MNKVDLNFVTNGNLDALLARRSHREEVLRECFAHKLKHLQDDAEAMSDYCRDMVRAKIECKTELEDAETFLKAVLLVILLLKRENGSE